MHLSGHGLMRDGVGHFAFEDERGREDAHDGGEMAGRLFAGSDVRLVFVSGCQSARAGAAGLCQRLTVAGHVPLALGWGASIADDRATEFARSLYHDLASGQPMDRAVAAARRELLEKGRIGSTGPSGSMRALRYRNSTPPKPPTSWWMNTGPPYGRNGPVSVTNCSATTSAACGKASSAGGACFSARTPRYRR